MDYIKAIARHFDVKPEQVLSYKVYGDEVATVIDRGIAGGPKYTFPLSELTDKPQMAEAEIVTMPEPQPKPKPQVETVRKYTGKRGVK